MRRFLHICCCILFIGLFAASVRAGDRVWRQAVIRLSDGTKLSGKICFTGNSLRIFHDRQKRHYDVPVKDIDRIDTLIEREYMYEKWIFREDGRDEKIYTGEKYPIRRLNHRVTFSDGKSITGKVLARSLYIRDASGKVRRLALKRKLEGEVGDKLKDLVYVKSVACAKPGEGILGTIKGTVELPEAQKLITLVGLNRTTDLSLTADVKSGNRFIIRDAPAGIYDLFIVAGRRRNMGGTARPDARFIYGYFSNTKNDKATQLSKTQLDKIQRWKSHVRSVFDAERPVYGAGTADRMYVLVRMQRTDKLSWSNPEQWKWVSMLKRYEIWHMSRRNDQWEIHKRHFLHRELLDSAKNGAEKVKIVRTLGGHELDKNNPAVNLTLTLPDDQ